MRLTEAISFLQKNPTGDELLLMTHIDVSALKLKMKKDKEFGKFVKKCRKDYKEKDIIKTEVIDLFSDLG